MLVSSRSEDVSMESVDEHAGLVPETNSSFTVSRGRNRGYEAVRVGDGDEIDLAFRAIGIDILVRDVTLISSPTWSRATRTNPTIVCQSVSALWEHGRLHAAIATDGGAIEALFRAVARNEVCAAGNIRFNTLAPVEGQCFGFVGRESILMPNLTVAQNLEFAINLITRARPEWKREMVVVTASFLALDSRRRACDLDAGETFRLKLGMELIRDPSILFVVDPFTEGLNGSSEAAVVDLLRRVAERLHKTVIVGAWTSPFRLLDASATTVLLGKGGRTLYSGPTLKMCDYFNQLDVRAAVIRGDRRAVTANTTTTRPRHSSACLEAESSTPELYRLSSPLPLCDDGTPIVRGTHTSSPNNGGDDHDQRGDDSANASMVRLTLPSTAIDLAVEWADSEAQTMLYAAKFYDSRQHAELLGAMSRRQVGPGGLLSDATGTSLLPQTRVRKLFFLLHHQLHILRTSPEAHSALTHLIFGLLGFLVLVRQLPANDAGGAFNARGILFVVITLPLLANQRHVGRHKDQLVLFLRHRNCGLYGTALFLITLVVRVMVEYAVHAVALMSFCAWLTPQTPLLLGVVAALGGLTHRLFLYVSAAAAPAAVGENSFALFYLTYATLGSGYLLNLTTFPRWMSWASVLRWGYAVAVREQASGRRMVCDGPSNASYCLTADAYIALQGATGDSLARSVCVLVSMCTCCVILLGGCLSFAL